jgi:hypothetical protein
LPPGFSSGGDDGRAQVLAPNPKQIPQKNDENKRRAYNACFAKKSIEALEDFGINQGATTKTAILGFSISILSGLIGIGAAAATQNPIPIIVGFAVGGLTILGIGGKVYIDTTTNLNKYFLALKRGANTCREQTGYDVREPGAY